MDYKTSMFSEIASMIVGRVDLHEHSVGREGLNVLGAAIAYNAALETLVELDKRGVDLTVITMNNKYPRGLK